MLRQTLSHVTVRTAGRGLRNITREVQACVVDAGIETGLCTIHLQHTSASLLIQ